MGHNSKHGVLKILNLALKLKCNQYKILQAMRQAKEEEQADIEEFDEDATDKGDDTVR